MRDGASATTSFGTSPALVVKKNVVGFNREAYVRFSLADVERWIAENSKSTGLGTGRKRNRGNGLHTAATAELPAGTDRDAS